METTKETQNTPSPVDSTDDDMPDLAASLFTANDTYGFKPLLDAEPFPFGRTQPKQKFFSSSRWFATRVRRDWGSGNCLLVDTLGLGAIDRASIFA